MGYRILLRAFQANCSGTLHHINGNCQPSEYATHKALLASLSPELHKHIYNEGGEHTGVERG